MELQNINNNQIQSSNNGVKDKTIKVMQVLQAYFKVRVDSGVQSAYCQLLSEYADYELEELTNRCMKNFIYFPKIKEMQDLLVVIRQEFYYQIIEYAQSCGDLNNSHDLDDALMLVAKKLYPQWFKDRMKYYYLQMRNGTHEKFEMPKQDLGYNIQDVFNRDGQVQSKTPKFYTSLRALREKGKAQIS